MKEPQEKTQETPEQAGLPAAQPGADFKPAEVLRITTAEQLKAISDPLRLTVLELILHEARTVKQIAKILKQPATKLYYHMNTLEEQGLVSLVDTRLKKGIQEKYFRAAGITYQVDRKLLSGQENVLQSLLSVVFDPTIEDLTRSFAAGLLQPGAAEEEQTMILSRLLCRLDKAAVPQFIQRFQALIAELEKTGAGEPAESAECLSYGCAIAFYPRIPSFDPAAHASHAGQTTPRRTA